MRKIKFEAKMYIDDPVAYNGKELSKEEQDLACDKARNISASIEGVVELHVVLSDGDTWLLGTFDNGQEKSKEYMWA